MKVTAYAHTHWDREWYRSFQEYRLRLIEVFDKVIDDLTSNKLNQFYFDGQTIALNDYLEIFPVKTEQIKNLIKSKKLMVGPWYVLADEFLVSGESLLRNLLVGINQSKDYGCNDFTGYLPDAFGHISDMPRILKSFNINHAVVWRGVGEQKTEFIWKSKDGSAITAIHLIEGYFQDILNQEWSIEKKSEELKKLLDKTSEYSTTENILIPVGADHLATAENINLQISKINKLLNDYEILSGSIFDYINNSQTSKTDLAEFEGELRDNSRNFILPATFSTRVYLKQLNAVSTWKLTKIAEPLQTLLEFYKLNTSRKNQLKYTWELLLKNHPHDSICGCSVDEVHDEMESRFTQINQLSDGIIARCLRDIAKQVKEGNIIVYNASDSKFTGVVEFTADKTTVPQALKSGIINKFPDKILYDIQKIPVQEDMTAFKKFLLPVRDIPPHSLVVIDKKSQHIAEFQPVTVKENSIENSKIKLDINKDGSFRLQNKIKNVQFDNLHIFEDRADMGDTYNFVPLKNDIPAKAELIKTKIIENTPLRSVLRAYYKMEIPLSATKNEKERTKKTKIHEITTDIILKAESETVEFKTEWVNCSKDHILQLKFKLTEKITKTLSEDNFGLIEREFDPDYSLSESMPAEKAKELKTNTAPIQRFVFAQGLGIITEGLSEYGVDGNELYITLLRSVGILSKGAIDTRGQAAGPPLIVEGAQCLRKQQVRYALSITDTPQELFKEADLFMGSVITGIGTAELNSLNIKELFSTDNENIYTYAVKSPHCEDKNGIIVRLMNLSSNTQKVKISVNSELSEFFEINSLEEKISKNLDVKKEITFNPYELKSFHML